MTQSYSTRWKSILEKLDDGQLIITASNRQADFLKNQFRYYKSSQQHNTWLQPNIYTEKQWKQNLYEHLRFHLLDSDTPSNLLSDNESRLLWERLVSADDDFLLDTRRTAERARQAITRLADWNLIDGVALNEEYSWREETTRLQGWHAKITEQCEVHHWLEPYLLNQWLTQKLKKVHNLKHCNLSHLLPKTIYFLGYQETVPSLNRLKDSLSDSGHDLHSIKAEVVTSTCVRHEYTDANEELIETALWAKHKWLEHPEHRIGVVIPNLNQCRDKVMQTFERVFCASQLLNSNDQILRPYDISLGASLAQYTLIDHALTLLSFLTSSLHQEELLLFIQSPYFFSDEEQLHIIDISNAVRRSRQASLTRADICYYSSRTENECASFNTFLERLEQFQHSTTLLPSQWSIQITDLLSELGWCENQKQTSVEYQTKEAWQKQIDQLAIVDHLTSVMSWSQYLSLLKRSIKETLFQPQTADCAIQIMGIFEATFLTFDHLHICGIDNRRWPESAKPNPFIPYEIQKQNDMPSSSAERELRVSRDLCRLMSESAEEVSFSHSKGNGEESLSVSPLIEALPVVSFDTKSMYQSPAEMIFQQQPELELFCDAIATKLSKKVTSGGTKLLQDIARCQFSAFAHHRLKAKAHDKPKQGIDALDRGNLVHHILEQCWLHVFNKDQQQLIQLDSENKLAETIRPIIQISIDAFQEQQQQPYSDAIIHIEQRRLERLLLQWFKLEAQRPQFRVKSVEQSIKADIDGHILTIQLDRVDVLEDQSLAIIDYKTGEVKAKDWFGERPEQPQLPMYSVVVDGKKEAVGAILYGKVKYSECSFVGIAEDQTMVSGVKKNFTDDTTMNPEHLSFQQQVNQWRNNLYQLMAEYSEGESAVAPRDEKACQYCDLHGFCRIGEQL